MKAVRILIVLLLMITVVSAAVPSDADDTVYCTVKFVMPDGTVLAAQEVEYGKQLDFSLIPEAKTIEGATFSGWGDITSPITSDTVFTASYIYETYRVRYFTEGMANCIHTEYVKAGSSASYDGIPEKEKDENYVYTFSGWSQNLSSVTSDVDVCPVFTASERTCEVRFCDYDRSLICTKTVRYNTSLTDMPEDPERQPTVGYTYRFKCWSITPNGNSPADFSAVKDTKTVFAYYEPSLAVYTVTYYLDGKTVGTSTAEYNTSLGTYAALDLYGGEAAALMYRDSAMTEEYTVSHRIIGNTDVYLKLIPGIFDAERDSEGNVTGDTVTVKHTEETISKLAKDGDAYTICDISQFGNGTTAEIDSESIALLCEKLGKDALLRISVPRGSLIVSADLLSSTAENSEKISLSVSNGPFSVKTASALKKVQYSAYYSTVLKADGRSVTELSGNVKISLPLSLSEGLHEAAWRITPGGSAIPLTVTYGGSYVTFETSVIQYFAVGTDTEGAAEVKERVVFPYGQAEYTVETDGGYHSVLKSLTADCEDSILFVPSAFGRQILTAVESGAFNNVSSASAIVIPETVTYFGWSDWMCGVTAVYFMGDCPEFEGTVPSFITIYRISDRSGWDSADTAVIDEYVYTGSYNKDPFSFTYIVINDSVMINRYVSGAYVSIPRYISADNRDRQVVYVGDAAFMRSDNESIYGAYGLLYRDYSLETVEIPSSVTEILTRAFCGSTLKNIYGWESVEHISDESFKGCTSLSTVTLPQDLLYIGPDAFSGCSSRSFSRLIVPDSVKYIGSNAFYGCSSLVNVTLGNGITEIPESCFAQCSSLSSITIPENVTKIGNSAFYNCSGILYIDLMNVKEVGSNAFQCAGKPSYLECVVMGEPLETIGDSAFGNCQNIAEIEAYCSMPGNMESAFRGVELDSVTYYVSSDVSGSWDVGGTLEILDEGFADEKDNTMAYVVIGMIVFFIILGILSVKYRTKFE